MHLKTYSVPVWSARGSYYELVKLSGAGVTPEAAVYHLEGRQFYRGRIDNRYVELGLERPSPTTHDLQDAIGPS